MVVRRHLNVTLCLHSLPSLCYTRASLLFYQQALTKPYSQQHEPNPHFPIQFLPVPFNTDLPHTFNPSECSRSSSYNFILISHLSHACYMSIPLSLLDFIILLYMEFNFKTSLSRTTSLNGLTFAHIICIIHNLLM